MNKQRIKNKRESNNQLVKDTPGRSIAKAITWRIIASATTFLAVFLALSYKALRNPDSQEEHLIKNAWTALYITPFEAIAKLILYYFHERMWTNIKWGKYWKQRAWRKLYRKMHQQQDNPQNQL
jgi:uncharacterized membrane protein